MLLLSRYNNNVYPLCLFNPGIPQNLDMFKVSDE